MLQLRTLEIWGLFHCTLSAIPTGWKYAARKWCWNLLYASENYSRFWIQIEYGLKRGTTDNSYLIKGGNHTALVDVPDQAFSKGFIEALKSTIDVKDIKYLIIGHISPKRIESLNCLAEALPEGGSARSDPLFPHLLNFQGFIDDFDACCNPSCRTLSLN